MDQNAPTVPAAQRQVAVAGVAPASALGTFIGPYKLMDVLGDGGMGTVYLAERREPFVQRVALKVIKAGMDSREVIARFEQERQALAVMDHPNIAKMLDGGLTAPDSPVGGLKPYFVMELVQGESITTYCDRERLTIRQRLELLIPVCEAVQHAHHKRIVHRDLKPSNILVAVKDNQAIPKVIDFGVAKSISQTMTEKAIFTETGRMIGTPEYMSPEQAAMGATDIDTRTDVYSLGVVLYELLAGVLPFDRSTLRSMGYDELRRVIREEEPLTPSRRLTALAQSEQASGTGKTQSSQGASHTAVEQIAHQRQTRHEQLVHDLRRELEWIPLKAMRKDRTRRYRTPSDLSDDLSAHLENRPLSAAPESDLYRLRKWIMRNGTLLGVGMMSAGIPLLAMASMLANSTVKSSLLAVGALLLTMLLSIWGTVDTLALAVRWQMKGAISFKEALGVMRWQFYLMSAPLIVSFFILPSLVVTTDPRLLGLVAALCLFVVLSIQVIVLKLRLRIGWKKASAVLTAQGICLIAGLLICAGVVRMLKSDLVKLEFNDVASALSSFNKVANVSSALAQYRVQMFYFQGKLIDAERVLSDNLTPADETQPRSVGLVLWRGHLHGRAARWKEATADFSKVVQLNPDEHWGWFYLAPILVESGESARYEKHCQTILAHFGATSDPVIAERMAKAILLRQGVEADLAAASKLADVAIAAGEKHGAAPWFQMTKGLAEYRQGHFDSAVQWTLKALSKPGINERDVAAYAVLAMAHHKLKHPEEAGAALLNGAEVAKTKLPKRDSADLGILWVDWLIAHILLREAHSVIEGKSAAPEAEK